MKYFAFILGYCLTGCIAATASDPNACETNTLIVPNDAGIEVGRSGTAETSVQVELTSDLDKLQKYGSLTIAVSRNILVANTGDLNWISHITIDIVPITDQINFQTQVFVDQDVSNPGKTIDLKTLISNDELYSYIEQGTIQFNVYVTGTVPAETIDVSQTLCVSSNVHIHESL